MKIIKEACIENATLLSEYIDAGVDRVELCDNLAVGGTTASLATIEYAKTVCRYKDAELGVIIRARGGDFVYKDFEKNIMLKDMKSAIIAGVDRIVTGALTSDGDIDKKYMMELIKTARLLNPKIKFTFHMAFDHIALYSETGEDILIKQRIEKIEELGEMGVDTVLTHGSKDRRDILENLSVLEAYVECGIRNGVSIMPGGGLDFKNLENLLERLPKVEAVHGTRIVDIKNR